MKFEFQKNNKLFFSISRLQIWHGGILILQKLSFVCLEFEFNSKSWVFVFDLLLNLATLRALALSCQGGGGAGREA